MTDRQHADHMWGMCCFESIPDGAWSGVCKRTVGASLTGNTVRGCGADAVFTWFARNATKVQQAGPCCSRNCTQLFADPCKQALHPL